MSSPCIKSSLVVKEDGPKKICPKRISTNEKLSRP